MQSQVYSQEDLKSILQNVLTKSSSMGSHSSSSPVATKAPHVPYVPPKAEAPSLAEEKYKVETPSFAEEKYKEAIRELSRALHETRQALKAKDAACQAAEKTTQQTKDSLEKATLELSLKNQTVQESHDLKSRFLRLMGDKKELEDRVTALTCEKATLSARLQTLSQKAVSHDELALSFDELTQEHAKAEESLKEKQKYIEYTDAKIDSLQATSHTQKERLEALEEQVDVLQEQLQAQTQEFAVSQACVIERSQLLEEEQKKHRLLAEEHLFIQKRVNEQENHIRLLEQHLGRRVKECALLSKQLEEQIERYSNLQTQSIALEQRLSTRDHDLEQAKKQEGALQFELEARASQMDELMLALEQKQEEISALKAVQAQFQKLEVLFKQSLELFEQQVSPVVEAEIKKQTPPAASQNDIFSMPTAPRQAPNTFFE